jgi:hypothetical protein
VDHATEGTLARKDDPYPMTEDGMPCRKPVFARGWCENLRLRKYRRDPAA